METKKILIVDDDIDIITVIETILRKEGYIGDFYNLKHCKSSNSKKQQILQHVVNNFM